MCVASCPHRNVRPSMADIDLTGSVVRRSTCTRGVGSITTATEMGGTKVDAIHLRWS